MADDPFRSPGYRRRIYIDPQPNRCLAALEDDYHAMSVTLSHDGVLITDLHSDMDRVPWTTCPGATNVISQTFTGLALDAVTEVGGKRLNCTHLYDLTLLAAAHAADAEPTCYDIAVADPVEGVVQAEIRRNGVCVLGFQHRADQLTQPVEAAGRSLFDLRDWIVGLPDAAGREAARLLQWATIIAHGRALTMAQHATTKPLAASCYTFHDDRRQSAERLPTIKDFSESGQQPLASFADERFGF